MSVHPRGTAASFVDQAGAWGRRLEDREADRLGMTVREARAVVARRSGVAPGTLENLRKGRLKSVGAHVYARLRAAVIRELEAEHAALEHELQLLRAAGSDPRENEIAAVVASREAVRSALREA